MRRFGSLVFAVSLTVLVACKRQSSDGAAGSAATATAATGSAAGSAMAAGSAATAATGSAGSAGPGSAAAGSAAMAEGSGASAAMGSDSGSAAMAAAAGASAAEAMAHRAGMCPSTVLGATTTSTVKGKAVGVTIESADKAAIAAIQKRTDKLLAERKAGATGGATHDQKGTHGGGQGLCPVYVPEGASATGKHEAKGVVVAITPKDKPDELAKEIDGRIAKSTDWVKANLKEGAKANQGGVGGGKGDDGSNHSGKGDGKGHERKKGGGGGGGGGTGGGTGGGGNGDKHG